MPAAESPAENVPVIAIDGPSASGKGTVAQAIAAALGFHFLDSGALYRLVALAALKDGVPMDDDAAVGAIAAKLDVAFEGGEILLRGERVTEAVRTERASALSSQVAALPSVRAGLLARQRAFRRPPGLVADGRDMGSVVFPDAALKVFLTASPEVRAERRHKQLMEKGISANIATLVAELRRRDERDTGRAVAPLRQQLDARLLDTSQLTVAQAVERVLEWYRSKE